MMMKTMARIVEMTIDDIQRTDAATVVVGAAGPKKIQMNDMTKVRRQGDASKLKTKHRAGI
jgi:hypothetical protein